MDRGVQVNLQSLVFRVEGQQMQALDERAAQEKPVGGLVVDAFVGPGRARARETRLGPN